MPAKRPSEAEREHLRAIGAAGADPEGRAPSSLDEVFERLEALRASLGRWADSRAGADDESELASHVRVHDYLKRRELERTRHG